MRNEADQTIPDPHLTYPLADHKRMAYLKAIITRPTIEVGDYSYYDDPNGPERFEDNNVLYHFPFIGDRLVIGRFCALGEGTTFIMNGANHRRDGISTFPFPVFGGPWSKHMDLVSAPPKGDTVVGHDVWFGYQSLVMPGVTIGHGAIIAARAVVTKDVPPYAVVGGNPGEIIKYRFREADITRLLDIAWWDWPLDKITCHLRAVLQGDIQALEKAAGD